MMASSRNSQSSQAISVYGLVDPTKDSLKYIGQSVDEDKRLFGHLSDAFYHPGASNKTIWLNRLLARGGSPEVIVFGRVRGKSRADRLERAWIRYAFERGCPLTNNGVIAGGSIFPTMSAAEWKWVMNPKGPRRRSRRNAVEMYRGALAHTHPFRKTDINIGEWFWNVPEVFDSLVGAPS